MIPFKFPRFNFRYIVKDDQLDIQTIRFPCSKYGLDLIPHIMNNKKQTMISL